MDMPNQGVLSAGWNCPRCGEINAPESRFCRKCGGENFPTHQSFSGQNISMSTPAPKGSAGKVILIIFLMLLLLGGSAVGGYFWYQSNLNKVAKEYLTSEAKNLKGVAGSINDLSTEKQIELTDEKIDLYLKKLEDEKNKAEKSLSDTRSAKERNDKAKTNKLVSGIDSLLDKFYNNAIEKLAAYGKYTTYRYQTTKLVKDLSDNLNKSATAYKNDPLALFKDYIKNLEEFKGQYSNVTPPEGLEEAHKKTVALFDQELAVFKNLASAYEAKDQTKFNKASNDLKELEGNNKKVYLEIYQLEQYYFEKLHEKFADLRKEGDDIRTQMMSVGSKMNMEVNDLSVNIDGW